MDGARQSVHPPHFTPPPWSGERSAASRESESQAGADRDGRSAPQRPAGVIGEMVMRGAECLAAALADCTADAGLNEARYRVLLALRQRTTGECSQADLANLLHQSESNLSTLLERMSGDGLILRSRSQTDRRRSQIRLTPLGLEALALAERTRAQAVDKLLREFSPNEAEQLALNLRRFVGDLERALDVSVRRASGFDPVFATRRTPALQADRS